MGMKEEFIFSIFATCHGAYLIEGELMGDSLDVEMFNYSQYRMEPSLNGKFRVENGINELDVLKVFEFESGL